MLEGYKTVEIEVSEGIATVSFNRPEKLNSFNQNTLDDFVRFYRHAREDDDIRVIIIQGNGRCFSSGLDRTEGYHDVGQHFERAGPVYELGPKTSNLFKPVISLVHGICGGGAFYWVCESDFVICSDDAQFMDPHTSYGLASPYVPAGLLRRIPIGEAMRMALMGLDERLSAKRAYEIGLVSEVTTPEKLRERGREIALKIAKKPTIAIQATCRIGWASIGQHPNETNQNNILFSSLTRAYPPEAVPSLKDGGKLKWELR